MNLENVRLAVQSGRIFSAVFTKADGTERKMTCRRGVRNHTKGGTLKFNPDEKGLLGVFEMPQKAYKFIKCENIKRLVIDGEVYD